MEENKKFCSNPEREWSVLYGMDLDLQNEVYLEKMSLERACFEQVQRLNSHAGGEDGGTLSLP